MEAATGRLCESVAALSGISDLARGHPTDEAQRACLVAMGLARGCGVEGPMLQDVYYTALVWSVGCSATSHEFAAAFGGDDVELRRRGDAIDTADPRQTLGMLYRMGGARLLLRAAPRAPRVAAEAARADCEVGAGMTRRLGLPPPVAQAVSERFERWDGRGSPEGKPEDAISLPARLTAVAETAVMFDQLGGPQAAAEMARRWAGKALDPELAGAFAEGAGELLSQAAVDDPWAAACECEPGPARGLPAGGLDAVARAYGEAVDLKSPFLHGHSSGVADLAARAAAVCGLDADAQTHVRLAGHLHDIGRAGVPTGIWERPGPLSRADWELVRLHPYNSERLLDRAPALAPFARTAGMHHERIDGSGYHRGASGQAIEVPARILAAADAFHALTEQRPHRPALTPDRAGAALAEMPLDRDAVAAVLEAAGQPRPRAREWPAGLTEREVQVLRLLAAGRSKRQIAGALFVSQSTVHTHAVHIYDKCGVSTRAALAMFAMEHDLVRTPHID
jgi:HD-GYP domain-containing protein (c-di-GMP phosphodiesterase class II)